MSSSSSGGFWKRVGAFVKNPTRDWSLTDEQALQDHENQEKVKAREDQKRQDDFIRKRELDGLRRLRKREVADLPMDDSLQTDIPDITAPPAPAHGRDETLRKINEIERSMSGETALPSAKSRFAPSRPMSGKPADRSYATTALASSLPAAAGQQSASTAGNSANVRPASAASTTAGVTSPLLRETLQTAAQSTTRGVSADDQLTVAAATRLSPDSLHTTAQGSGESWLRSSNDFMPSAFFAVEVHEALSSNPLFDQAVMDFANGDDAAAESALREAISNCNDLGAEKELWLALFDLFRASGQIGKFDALVVDFVGRFQTSAPMAEDGLNPTPAAAPPAAAFKPSLLFSATVDTAQAERLRKQLLGNPPAVEVNFSEVRSISAGALPILAEALHKVNQTRATVTLRGADRLLTLCAAQAPAMQRDADTHWWSLRLELLRLLGQQDAFDAVALDYCVTYEISPPAWESSLARVEFGEGSSALNVGGTATPTADFEHSAGMGHSTLGPGSTRSAQLHLSGEILGSASTFLAPLDQAARVHDQLSISMRTLRRIDFSSAGALLNWAMLQRSAGKTLQFTGVHRLIAGLFSILGLHEHALIQLRRD